MAGTYLSLSNARTRLALILTTFFALALFIWAPHGSDDDFENYGRLRASSEKLSSAANKLFGWGPPPTIEEVQHPIPKLMHDGQNKFRALISKQSKTLNAAVKEYRARYKRDPPIGFDEWFAFAQANNVKIIDEYDGLMNDLEPFWGMSGEELRRRALQIGTLPSVDLVRLRGGKTVTVNMEKGYEDAEVSARAKGFRVMMEKFQHRLPDMDFPINAKAEGRILVPWENANYPNTTKQDSSDGVEDMLGGPFIPDWRGDGSVWDAYRKTCPPSTQARRLFGALRPSPNGLQRPLNRLEAASGGFPARPDGDFNFAETVDDRFDFCSQPWARYNQGHFFSDWRTIPVLYPMFSPAKGHGFSDIMIPSHYYYSSTRRYTYGWDPVNMVLSDDDENEQPWEKKKDLIFWRGATTGGGSSPPGFLSQYQRHRFIKMTSDSSDANRTVVFPYPPGSPNYEFAKVPVSKLNADIMDTAFTKAVGCTQYQPGGCDGMRKDHRFADAVPLGEHWKYKYLIDFDGMGYSARLFAFLMSESAVIKSTVYREFFSDWIQPWLHYIPLTSNYGEIYNIYAYFSGATPSMEEALLKANRTTDPEVKIVTSEFHDGDAQLRKIARAGRKWKMTIGRKVDMETYVYRLCLEYARLWADDREAMTYKG